MNKISSSSSSYEDLSTISPAGVTDLDMCMLSSAESAFYFDTNYQESAIDDPLAWLSLDGPDVPIFPDFQENYDLTLQPRDDGDFMIVDSSPWIGDPKVTVQSLFLEEPSLI
jgi:hypothetical protein